MFMLIVSNYVDSEMYPDEVIKGFEAASDPRIPYSYFLEAKKYFNETLGVNIEFEHTYSYSRADKFDPNYDITKRFKYYEVFASYGYCSPERIERGDCCTKYFSKVKGESNPNGWTLIDYGRSSEGPNIALFSDEQNTYTILKSDLFKKVVISFAGTKEPIQLVEQILTSYMVNPDFKTLNLGIKINQYIDKRTKAIIDLIFNKENVEKMSLKEGYQVIFVGHSLGGSMASATLLYAIDRNYLSKAIHRPVVITYGQPRTGNENFAIAVNYFAEVIYRNVNTKDVVSDIPFYIDGHRHTGGEILIGGDKNDYDIMKIEDYTYNVITDEQRLNIVDIVTYVYNNLDNHLFYYGKEVSRICG